MVELGAFEGNEFTDRIKCKIKPQQVIQSVEKFKILDEIMSAPGIWHMQCVSFLPICQVQIVHKIDGFFFVLQNCGH